MSAPPVGTALRPTLQVELRALRLARLHRQLDSLREELRTVEAAIVGVERRTRDDGRAAFDERATALARLVVEEVEAKARAARRSAEVEAEAAAAAQVADAVVRACAIVEAARTRPAAALIAALPAVAVPAEALPADAGPVEAPAELLPAAAAGSSLAGSAAAEDAAFAALWRVDAERVASAWRASVAVVLPVLGSLASLVLLLVVIG